MKKIKLLGTMSLGLIGGGALVGIPLTMTSCATQIDISKLQFTTYIGSIMYKPDEGMSYIVYEMTQSFQKVNSNVITDWYGIDITYSGTIESASSLECHVNAVNSKKYKGYFTSSITATWVGGLGTRQISVKNLVNPVDVPTGRKLTNNVLPGIYVQSPLIIENTNTNVNYYTFDWDNISDFGNFKHTGKYRGTDVDFSSNGSYAIVNASTQKSNITTQVMIRINGHAIGGGVINDQVILISYWW